MPPPTTQRATQGFVGTLTWTVKRPMLTAIEILWRWIFGIPALWLMYREGSRVLAAVPWQSTGIAGLTINELLTDPLRASVTLANFASMVLPGAMQAALWLGPLLLGAWIVISTAGRTLLLLRMDHALKTRPATLVCLQAIRLLPLVLIAALWWFGLQSLARIAILNPIANGGEPQMMLYVGGVIVLSLGLFVLASAVGWVFSAAPIVAMRDGSGPLTSLRDVVRLRNVRGSLVEINMVLSIVKIMLLVLAMAFSAFPLPFVTYMTEEYLLFWTALVAVWYFACSDFFHVARLAGYVHLLQWRELTQADIAASQ